MTISDLVIPLVMAGYSFLAFMVIVSIIDVITLAIKRAKK